VQIEQSSSQSTSCGMVVVSNGKQ